MRIGLLIILVVVQSFLFGKGQKEDKFSSDLFRKVALENKGVNVLISPISVKVALMMLYQGATDKSKMEFEKLFQAESKEGLNNSLRNLLEDYQQQFMVLSLNNSIWISKDYSVLAEFRNNLENYFKAVTYFIDFTKVKKACDKINFWVAQKTNNMIKKVATEKNVDPLTKLVLINTIYFKDSWKNEFNEKENYDDSFYCYDGNTEKVTYMKTKKAFNFYEDKEGLIIELPYQNENYSFVALMPKHDNIYKYIANGKQASLRDKLKKMRKQDIEIHLPKFEIEGDYELKRMLKDLGLEKALSKTPDYEGINKKNELYVNSIVHKTKIKLGEKGTEASAATAIFMRMKSAGPSSKYIKVRLDTPFYYMIYDKKNNLALFSGLKVK